MRIIDLSGVWRYETDEDNVGIEQKFYNRTLKNEGFSLPGSTCDNKIGKPCEEFTELTKEAARSLVPRYDYIGAIWLQRDFVTEDLTDKDVKFFMERVNIASDVWLDGEKIDRRIIGLSTPHTYNLSKRLTAGEHTLTVRLDNRNLINMDIMASGYSPDTQSIWLGAVGRIELQIEDVCHIADIRVFPQEKSARVECVIDSDCHYPHEKDRRNGVLHLIATAPNGKALKKIKQKITLYSSRQVIRVDYPMGHSIEYWDEFNPALYTMTVKFEAGEYTDERSAEFGMRTVYVKNKRFMINRRPFSLRGTTDCAINPLTGYPPTDVEYWMDMMKTIRDYGLNHVRFHAWCPPDAAFTAADKLGIYVLAEMPLWLNFDVCKLETGDDPIHREYYTQEALRISRAYGNHPSFIMFSNGNENLGDFELLEDITTQIKAMDNRRLYTLTSNFDHPVSPCEDYMNACECTGNRVRMQTLHDVLSEHTAITYDDAVHDTPVPVVSFEVGQFCVYPDVGRTGDYTGNLAPLNFEIIKKSMIEKGVYPKLKKYVRASGAFAAMMYKEDIEAALRTDGMGGFQLLSLTDYTGQGTATVGLLDVFRKSKGIITPEEFTTFCSPIVPLFMAKRLYTAGEKIKAELRLYNASGVSIHLPEYRLRVLSGDETVYETTTRKTRVSIDTDFVEKPTMLTVELTVEEFTNRWTIFVYPKAERQDVPTIRTLNEVCAMAETGGIAVVEMTRDNLQNPIDGLFKPVFWSPAWFPSTRASGLIIEGGHPVFEKFPTRDTADFQWKHPIDKSVGADISALGAKFEPIIEPVPNFFDNTPRSPLFEARVGKAKLLFCGFDMSAKDTASAALMNSIAEYLQSDKFEPKQEISVETIGKIMK